MVNMNFNIFLLIIFLFNLIQISTMGLSYDEAYYWIYSFSSSFGHFDHPPMVGWLIKLGVTIFGKNELGVRFFFNVMQILTLKLMWEMTSKKNILVFIMATLSMPLIASAGMLALPDTPLVFFSVLLLFYVKKYIDKDTWKNTLAIACIIPLLFYSKYHGIVVVLFTVLANLSFLKRKSFWVIVCLTIIFYLPHVYWQYTHDFVTFKFHLFGRSEKHFNLLNILDYVGGQILLAGLLSAPFVLIAAYKANNNNFDKTLQFNVWGMFILLFLSSLRNKIEANWTVTNSAFLVILITSYISKKNIKKFLILSLPTTLLLVCIKGYVLFPSNDPIFRRAYELYNWSSIVSKVDEISNGQRVVANKYQLAAKYSFYSNSMVPSLHIDTRKSEFIFIQNEFYPKDGEVFTYLSYSKFSESVKIGDNYPKALYATPNMTLDKLREYLKR